MKPHTTEVLTAQKGIKILFLSRFLGNLFFYTPIFALFLLNEEITLPTIILGQMVYSLAAFMAEIPTGVLADRWGHNKSITAGYILSASALLVIALFPAASVLMLMQAVRGIANGFLSGSNEALLCEYGRKLNRDYKRDLSHMASYQELGFAISTMAAGVIIQMYGQESYMFIMTISFAAILAAGLVSARLPNMAVRSRKELSRFYELQKAISAFKTSRLLKSLFIVAGLVCGGKFLLIDLYQPYFESAGVQPIMLGASLSVGSLACFVLVRNVYRIEKFAGGPRRSLGLLAALTGLCYVAFGAIIGPYVTVVIFTALFSVSDSAYIFVSDYANKRADSDIRATVLSFIGLAQEMFKTAYKGLFAIMLGVIPLSRVFVLYGFFLVGGAAVSYWILGRRNRG